MQNGDLNTALFKFKKLKFGALAPYLEDFAHGDDRSAISVCLCVYLSISVFICLCPCLSLFLYVLYLSLSICLCFSLFSISLYLSISVYVSMSLSPSPYHHHRHFDHLKHIFTKRHRFLVALHSVLLPRIQAHLQRWIKVSHFAPRQRHANRPSRCSIQSLASASYHPQTCLFSQGHCRNSKVGVRSGP